MGAYSGGACLTFWPWAGGGHSFRRECSLKRTRVFVEIQYLYTIWHHKPGAFTFHPFGFADKPDHWLLPMTVSRTDRYPLWRRFGLFFLRSLPTFSSWRRGYTVRGNISSFILRKKNYVLLFIHSGSFYSVSGK